MTTTDAPKGDSASNANADAAGRFCTGGHVFCADFDVGGLADGWSGDNVAASGIVERSTTQSVSAPASFHAQLPRRAAGNLAYALLYKSFFGAWRRTVFDFDMLLETPDWQSGDINAAYFEFGFREANQSAATYYFVIGNGYTQITGPTLNMVIDPVPLGRFFHVHVDVTPGGALAATVDGKAYSGVAAPISGTAARTDLNIGITGYNAPVPGFSVFYDNVVVDQP
jgi:hypothetical protein